MIQRSHHQNYRTAALIGAAVVFSAASHLHAQALTNLFGGATSNNAASVTSLLSAGGTRTSGITALGSGYNGSVTINNGLSALSTLSETVNATATPNALVVATSGAGVTAGGSFMATVNIANAGLLPNTQYQFAVNRGNTSNVNLLGNVNFTLGLNNTTFVDTTTGTGILGGLAVNALGLLTSNGSANFVFTTPLTVPANATLNFTVSGDLGANVLPGTFTLAGAAITNVPEPGALVTTTVLGMVGLAVWRARRQAIQG